MNECTHILVTADTRLTIPSANVMHHPAKRVFLPRQQRRPLALMPAVMPREADDCHRAAVHHDAAEDHKRRHRPHGLDGRHVRMAARRRGHRDRLPRLQLRASLNGQEHAPNPHGAEMAAEQRLAVGVHVRDEPLERQEDRDTAEQQDQDQNGQEPADGDVRGELPGHVRVPGDDGAEVDEHG